MTITPTSAPAPTDRLRRLSATFLTISTVTVTTGVILQSATGTGEQSESGEAISFDSPLPVVAALVLSVLLTIAMWRRPGRAVLAITILFCLAAAALDILELAHLTDRPGLAVLAAIAGLTHLATAVTAVPVLHRKC